MLLGGLEKKGETFFHFLSSFRSSLFSLLFLFLQRLTQGSPAVGGEVPRDRRQRRSVEPGLSRGPNHAREHQRWIRQKLFLSFPASPHRRRQGSVADKVERRPIHRVSIGPSTFLPLTATIES